MFLLRPTSNPCPRDPSGWKEIRDALTRSSVALILVSDRSKDRPWIHFEAGAVAFAKVAKVMIPVCHSGLRPSDLPQTLQGWQAVNLANPDGVRRLCFRIASVIQLRKPSSDWGSVADRLRKILTKHIRVSDKLVAPEIAPSGAKSAWVFSSSEDPNTQAAITSSIANSREQISLYGIGLNALWNNAIRNSLVTAAKRHVRVRICMSSYKSPDIIRRLKEEKIEDKFQRKIAEGLIPVLVEAERRVNDRRYYEIRLFEHNPAYSMLMFDNDLYLFAYPFKRLGNLAPTYFTQAANPATEFFLMEFNQVFRKATPAATVCSVSAQVPGLMVRSAVTRKRLK